jgi:hypothetical protein
MVSSMKELQSTELIVLKTRLFVFGISVLVVLAAEANHTAGSATGLNVAEAAAMTNRLCTPNNVDTIGLIDVDM